MVFKKMFCVAVAVAFAGVHPGAFAQGTDSVFTYQGNLESAGDKVTGLYDLRFRIYDAASGVGQVGGEVDSPSISVVDGLFSLPLDFGEIFDGAARWLEIDVMPAGGGAYTTLSPRQRVNAAPLATFALKAGEAVTAQNGVPAGTMIVGSGKTSPEGFRWSGQSFTIEGGWTGLTSSPRQVSSHEIGAMVDGKLYAVTGYPYDGL